jgi:hypothetical protein
MIGYICHIKSIGMKNLIHLILLAVGLLVAALSLSIVIESMTSTHGVVSQISFKNGQDVNISKNSATTTRTT